jgi:cytochrome c556
MKMKLGVAAAVIAMGIATIAYADFNEDVIKLRRGLMEIANQQAIKIVIQMARGDVPFDTTLAQAALLTISHDAEVIPSLFPPGTESGFNTKAGPAIWSDFEGFKALSDKMATDAKAAAEAATTLDGLKGVLNQVGQNCQACHEKYRSG